MSGRAAVSPGGQILRSSRLFSIPTPLPEPQSNSFKIGSHKSLTATKTYPSHQAITTPKSSRQNGDWGFKRSFPLKSTYNTSTPLIRVKQVDTIENVTDFASAADLSLTLEKFSEMHVAPLLPKGFDKDGNVIDKRRGVFEEDMDVTDLKLGEGAERKWRFRGPWLARMDEGSFEAYISKRVRPRREEFRRIIRERMVVDTNRLRAAQALDKGEPAPAPITLENITDQEYTEYLRMLRSQRAVLYDMVAQFLDLAPLTKPVGIVQSILTSYPAKESPYGLTGAPQTHPSAGIGYLRTNAFMENHPVFGPQAHRTPVQARVVFPRVGVEPAKLGVGGMVTDVPLGDNEFNVRYTPRSRTVQSGIKQLDTVTKGGSKAWIEPQGVTVDPSGSVVLQVKEPNQEARLVAEEENNPGLVYNSQKRAEADFGVEGSRRLGRVADEMFAERDAEVRASTVKRTSQWYGLDQ